MMICVGGVISTPPYLYGVMLCLFSFIMDYAPPLVSINGQYKSIRPELLGAKVLNQLFDSKKASSLDAIFCGNAVGTGGNIARLMGLYSHLPNTIPAVTVDMQCASGMMSVEMAYADIASGMMDTVIAGGNESSSLQPLRTYADHDDRSGDYMVAQFAPNEISPLAMLEGAERTHDKILCRCRGVKSLHY